MIPDFNKIQEEYNNNIKLIKTKKKEFGEVLTPSDLINKMIDQLPEEVWQDKTKKWLDPAAGFGSFYLFVIPRLMESLKQQLPDDELRYKWIIEKMIYACELQEENCIKYKSIFDPLNEYKLNLYCGSFLDEGFNKQSKIWEEESNEI